MANSRIGFKQFKATLNNFELVQLDFTIDDFVEVYVISRTGFSYELMDDSARSKRENLFPVSKKWKSYKSAVKYFEGLGLRVV